MADQDERPIRTSPGSDEAGDISLRVRVVSRPPGRIVESHLDVDDNQGGGHGGNIAQFWPIDLTILRAVRIG